MRLFVKCQHGLRPPIHHNQVSRPGDGGHRMLNPHYITFLESPQIPGFSPSLSSYSLPQNYVPVTLRQPHTANDETLR